MDDGRKRESPLPPTQPDMVGRNLYETDTSCLKCHKTFDVEKKIIEGRETFTDGTLRLQVKTRSSPFPPRW